MGNHSRKLTKERKHTRYDVQSISEVYANGIFKYDITSFLKDFSEGLIPYTSASVSTDELTDMACDAEILDSNNIDAADTSRPVILFEMVPDYKEYASTIPEDNYITRGYALADGNHRVAKAKKLGLTVLSAALIRMEDHIQYMYENYDSYVEYWNMKLKERERDKKIVQ